MRVLPKSFYLNPTLDVARGLLGKFLVRELPGGNLAGRIVETEAYLQEDPASHSFRGPTDRSAVMFEEGGIAYVYLIYGIHHCFNVVTEARGYGSAVLVRALEPVEGIARMWGNRFGSIPLDARKIRTLASGPGNLARAMEITRTKDNGKSLITSELTIREDPASGKLAITASPRIGIRRGTERHWRFYLPASPYLSRPRQEAGDP
jgi:DNA-3-methyladenine glycosylase